MNGEYILAATDDSKHSDMLNAINNKLSSIDSRLEVIERAQKLTLGGAWYRNPRGIGVGRWLI